MKKLQRYGFIVMAQGYASHRHHAQFTSPFFNTEIRGVSSLEEGCKAAKDLVDKGVEIIELCGAFGEVGVKEVIAAIEGKVPVGFVQYTPTEDKKLMDYLKK